MIFLGFIDVYCTILNHLHSLFFWVVPVVPVPILVPSEVQVATESVDLQVEQQASPWITMTCCAFCFSMFSGTNSHIYIYTVYIRKAIGFCTWIWHHLTSFDIIWSYLPKYSGTRWTRFRYQLLSESPIFAALATCQKTRDLWREVSTTEEDSELSSLSSEEVSAATWNDHPPTYKN